MRSNPQMVPDPELRAALLSSVAEMQRILRADHTQRTEAERRRHELANADPFDLDAQRKIEEEITKENVAANLEQAMEQAPEMVVGSVFMLYVHWCVIVHISSRGATLCLRVRSPLHSAARLMAWRSRLSWTAARR